MMFYGYICSIIYCTYISYTHVMLLHVLHTYIYIYIERDIICIIYIDSVTSISHVYDINLL